MFKWQLMGEKKHPSLIWLVLVHTVHVMFTTAVAPVSSPRSQSVLVQCQFTVPSSPSCSWGCGWKRNHLLLLHLPLVFTSTSAEAVGSSSQSHLCWTMPSQPWMLRDDLSCYSCAPSSWMSPPFEVVHVSHTVKILNKYTSSFDAWRPSWEGKSNTLRHHTNRPP